MNNGSDMNNRLATIATRQRKSFARDILFAAFVVLASVVSLSSVATAADAAQPSVAVSR